MNLPRLAAALLTAATLAIAAPAFAAGNNSSGDTMTNGGGQNALSGNGSNGAVGDNPNATDPSAQCFRRDSAGHETKIVCPGDLTESSTGKSGLTAPAK